MEGTEWPLNVSSTISTTRSICCTPRMLRSASSGIRCSPCHITQPSRSEPGDAETKAEAGAEKRNARRGEEDEEEEGGGRTCGTQPATTTFLPSSLALRISVTKCCEPKAATQ